MKTREKYLDAKLQSIPEAIDFIGENLDSLKVKSKDKIKAELLAEEFLAYLINSKDENDSENIRVAVAKQNGKKTVVVSYKGKYIENIEDVGLGVDLSLGEMSPDTESVIRRTIISAHQDDYTISYKNGINKISINVGRSSNMGFIHVIYTILLAVIVGILLRVILPANVSDFINENILKTIEELFLNAFKLITGPVIFFSIASCFGMFTDLKELGKTAVKIICFYLVTTGIAMAVALMISEYISPGEFGELSFLASGELAQSESISVVTTIRGIIPDNIIKPFLELSTLQIIVIAILVGIAAGKLGEKSSKVMDFLNNANDLFLKITGIVTKFLHIMIFASVTALVMSIHGQAVGSLLSLLICVFFGFAVMFVIYNVIVMIMTKTRPSDYIKKSFPAWLNAFVLHSSNASIPRTMEVCDKNLKISPKVFSFSIPLGATINMDGFTIALTISVLFFAKVFGVEFTPGNYVALIFMVIILSVGAPGIPGAGAVCMSVLLGQFAIPIEALALFVSVYALLDPAGTANNVFGDVTGTYVIAKRNGLVKDD